MHLLQQAREAGAHALVLNDVALDGAAMNALKQVLNRDGLKPHVLSSYVRASLDATQDGETLLRDALGTKKLKELRDHLTANADNVGKKFPEEARKMHYGEIEHRSIYGEASPQDAKDLHEEGIEFHPLPVLPDERN